MMSQSDPDNYTIKITNIADGFVLSFHELIGFFHILKAEVEASVFSEDFQ